MKQYLLHEWVERVASELGAADLYYGHGTDNAWDEAVHLVLGALGLPLDSGDEVGSLPVSPENGKHISAMLVERIQRRKPLPYITHEAWFAGMPFYVDERVLVPRSPFGEWIMRQFRPWIDPAKVRRILEIGTGSGCMAVAAAHAFPEAHIDAVDIDLGALEVAQINVDKYHLSDRVTLFQSDCFEKISTQQYDIIMSNPPYVGAQEMESLPAEYLHEPRKGLSAPENGLAIAKRIIVEAGSFLTEDGILVVEVGNSDEALQRNCPNIPFTWLEQEYGGHGLFLLTRDQLLKVKQ